MIADRLYESVNKKGNVCVGLDTAASYIPEGFRSKFENIEDAVFEFNKKIIDATGDISGCFKVQIAYYEALGIKGLQAYKKTLAYLREQGHITIADIKRGDIAATASMYAKAHFEGDFESDMITLSPYMGLDSIDPYLNYVKDSEKGLFILLRTSNPGAKDIQYIETSENKRVYDAVGDKLHELSEKYMGSCGYSSIGAVMGCTHIDEGIEIRKKLHNMFFLIPGYGAQGGAAKDVAIYLKDGNGGVVNSSRAVLMAYKKKEDGAEKFDIYAREEVLRMKEAIMNESRVR
jgi:orotidine-5'-phosphate decarboxylase